MAGSDAVSALGRLAGVTVDQVKACSKLGTLLEATVCSQQVDSVGKRKPKYKKLKKYEVISTMLSSKFEK